MEKESRKFLEDLLATPGPAGAEMEAQRVWKKYAENFSDRIDVDNMGNVTGVINPDAKFRIMLAGHIDEIGFIIKRIDDKGFLYVDKVGGISHKIAPGMKVEILGFNGKLTGVIGANAQHHGGLKDDFSFEDLYIDCGAKCKEDMDKIVRLGDFAVYKRETEFLLNNRISGKALDNRTGAFVVAEVLKRLYEDRPTVGVYCSSTVSEEIGLHGAYFAASAVNPDIAIACDVTFATDYPGVNKDKYGDYHLGKGPVLAVGSPINRKMNSLLEESAKKLEIELQYELTPGSTGTDADRMRFTGRGVPVALVSLPLRYMHSPVETASLDDIEKEIDLLVDMIKGLTGEENLCPLD